MLFNCTNFLVIFNQINNSTFPVIASILSSLAISKPVLRYNLSSHISALRLCPGKQANQLALVLSMTSQLCPQSLFTHIIFAGLSHQQATHSINSLSL